MKTMRLTDEIVERYFPAKRTRNNHSEYTREYVENNFEKGKKKRNGLPILKDHDAPLTYSLGEVMKQAGIFDEK